MSPKPCSPHPFCAIHHQGVYETKLSLTSDVNLWMLLALPEPFQPVCKQGTGTTGPQARKVRRSYVKLGAVARALSCSDAGAEDGHVNPSSKTRFRPTTSRLWSQTGTYHEVSLNSLVHACNATKPSTHTIGTLKVKARPYLTTKIHACKRTVMPLRHSYREV